MISFLFHYTQFLSVVCTKMEMERFLFSVHVCKVWIVKAAHECLKAGQRKRERRKNAIHYGARQQKQMKY